MSHDETSHNETHALVVAKPSGKHETGGDRSKLPALHARPVLSPAPVVQATAVARPKLCQPGNPFPEEAMASRLARSSIRWNTETKESQTTLQLTRKGGKDSQPGETTMQWAREASRRQTEHSRRQVRDGKPEITNNSRETTSYDERCTVTEDNTPRTYRETSSPKGNSTAIALSDKPVSALAQLRARRNNGIALREDPAIQADGLSGKNKKTRTVRYTRTHHKTEGPNGNSWTVFEKFQATEKTSSFQRVQDRNAGQSGIRLVEDEKEYTSLKTWLVEPDSPPRLLSRKRDVKNLTTQ